MSQLADELRISPSFSDRCKRVFLGKADDQRPAPARAAVQPCCAGRAVAGRHLLDRLRFRAGHDRTAAGRRDGRIRVTAPGHRRHPVDPGTGRRFLPSGGGCLHPRRRLLRGRPRELRTQGRPDRRGIAADRLRRHRRGAVRGRNGGGGVGDTCPRSLQPGNHRWHCSADVLCQPAWITRSRAAVCAADLFIRRHGLVDDRRRDHS